MERLRLFVAVAVPPEVKALVASLQGAVVPAEARGSVRWIDSSGTHITLKYLGETDRLPEIVAGLERIGPRSAPFRLSTTQTGAFPNLRSPRVLWLGIGGDLHMLGSLQGLVEAELAPLGFPTEARAFTPHLTLGRVKSGDRSEQGVQLRVQTRIPPPIEWTVDQLVLMRSQTGPDGPRYTPLQHVQLAGGGRAAGRD